MSIHVIAGSHKRRTLKTPKGQKTRPTAARVREALFSILGNVEGMRVLDLYAGSGALGIEALSRGAGHACFVERDRAAVACIRENLKELGLEAQATVLPLSVERAGALAGLPPFDLAFADPPWAEIDRAKRALATLPEFLANSARLIVEHPARESVTVDGFGGEDTRQWGDTGVTVFRRCAR